MIERMLILHQAAGILKVSPDTIRRWEKKGLIKSFRSPQNHRLFNLVELERVISKHQGNGSTAAFKVLKSPKTKHTVIELFSGCGGMALGFENAGLSAQMLVEIDKNAVATLKKNRSNWNIVSDDIKNVSFKQFAGKVEVVAGGFPCQAFSYAGKGLGFGDPRGTLFIEFLRAVREVKPKIALGENVRGLIQHDGGRTLATMIHYLEKEGYNVVYHLLRAQFLDVAQKRERLIIIGVRKDLSIPHLFPKERDYTVSLRQVLKDVPDSDGYEYSKRKFETMKLIPEGGYWRDLPDDLQRKFMGASYFHTGGRTGMARRLSMDEPSLTLTCNPAQKQTERCHPNKTRPLNIREYARIQSFPDDWIFTGTVSSQYRQIGNAVPVNLAHHVGRGLIQMLEGKMHPDFINKKTNEPTDITKTDDNQIQFALA